MLVHRGEAETKSADRQVAALCHEQNAVHAILRSGKSAQLEHACVANYGRCTANIPFLWTQSVLGSPCQQTRCPLCPQTDCPPLEGGRYSNPQVCTVTASPQQ